eukprot:7929687-Pyramimonas_sp.AAC.1
MRVFGIVNVDQSQYGSSYIVDDRVVLHGEWYYKARVWSVNTAQVWGDVLGVEGLKANDNFWDIGGTSVLAVQMLRELEQVDAKPSPCALTRVTYPCGTPRLYCRSTRDAQPPHIPSKRAVLSERLHEHNRLWSSTVILAPLTEEGGIDGDTRTSY